MSEPLRARNLSAADSSGAARIDTPMVILREGDWLVAYFGAMQQVASWAIVGGGVRRARTVAWLQVREPDLRPPVNAEEFLRSRLCAAGLPDAVGLLTSRDLDSYCDVWRSYRDVRARCIATVGLGNALRAGDPPGVVARIGTINVLTHVSVPLSDRAMLEALCLTAEAKALAVREAIIPSQLTREPASGTGTDCLIVAAPEVGEPERYVGKHTVAGHLIGAVVHDAVSNGIQIWKRDRAASARRRAQLP